MPGHTHGTAGHVDTSNAADAAILYCQALYPAVTPAAAATELLGRVQASLTAGFNASAAAWPASSAPVMPLPTSTVGLLLAAPAAAKALNPLGPGIHVPQPQLARPESVQQQPQTRTFIVEAAVPAAPNAADTP